MQFVVGNARQLQLLHYQKHNCKLKKQQSHKNKTSVTWKHFFKNEKISYYKCENKTEKQIIF